MSQEELNSVLILIDELAMALNGEMGQDVRELYESVVKTLEKHGAKNEM